MVEGHHPHRLALGLHAHGQQLHLDDAAILPAPLHHPAGLRVPGLTGVGHGLRPLLFGGDQLVQIAAHHVLETVAEQPLERRVRRDDVLLQVERYDGHGAVAHDRRQVMPLPQRIVVEPRVLDGDARLLAEEVQEPEVRSGEAPLRVLVPDVDGAHGPTADPERCNHDGPGIDPRVLLRATGPLPVVGDDHHLTGPHHVAHGPLAQRDPGAQRALAHVVVGHHLELRGRLVVRGELPAGRVQDLHRPLQHRVQQRGELQLGGEVGDGGQQRLLLVRPTTLRCQEPDPAEGDPRVLRGGGEDLEVVGAERVGARALHHQHAHGPVAVEDRDVHLGAGAEPGHVLGVLGYARGEVEPPIGQGAAGDAGGRREPEVGWDVAPPHARPEHALVRGLIQEEDADEIVAEGVIPEPVHHAVADLGLVVGHGDAGAEPEQRRLSALSRGRGGDGGVLRHQRRAPFRPTALRSCPASSLASALPFAMT